MNGRGKSWPAIGRLAVIALLLSWKTFELNGNVAWVTVADILIFPTKISYSELDFISCRPRVRCRMLFGDMFFSEGKKSLWLARSTLRPLWWWRQCRRVRLVYFQIINQHSESINLSALYMLCERDGPHPKQKTDGSCHVSLETWGTLFPGS